MRCSRENWASGRSTSRDGVCSGVSRGAPCSLGAGLRTYEGKLRSRPPLPRGLWGGPVFSSVKWALMEPFGSHGHPAGSETQQPAAPCRATCRGVMPKPPPATLNLGLPTARTVIVPYIEPRSRAAVCEHTSSQWLCLRRGAPDAAAFPAVPLPGAALRARRLAAWRRCSRRGREAGAAGSRVRPSRRTRRGRRMLRGTAGGHREESGASSAPRASCSHGQVLGPGGVPAANGPGGGATAACKPRNATLPVGACRPPCPLPSPFDDLFK